MNKKILSILICLSMIISCFTLYAYADNVIEVEIDLGGLFDDTDAPEGGAGNKNEGSEGNESNTSGNNSSTKPSTGNNTSNEKPDKTKDANILEDSEKLYRGLDEENMPMIASMAIEDAETFQNFTFIPYTSGLEAVVSEPMIGSIAHSVVLVKCPDAQTAQRVAFEMASNCNPRKWICVEADDVKAVSGGCIAMLMMTTKEGGMGESILTNFKRLYGIDKSYEFGGEDTAEWKNPFKDVKESDWYYETVKYVNQTGIINGMTEDTFAPGTTLTRAMLVTILYRVEGSPAVNADSKFGDVKKSDWYGAPVIWAAENGIVNGVSETEFAPNTAITREQIAAIMYRYAGAKGYDTTQGGMAVKEYEDYDKISSWAKEAMQWAVNAKLINGKTETTVNPADKATRAEAATIVMRFIKAN